MLINNNFRIFFTSINIYIKYWNSNKNDQKNISLFPIKFRNNNYQKIFNQFLIRVNKYL